MCTSCGSGETTESTGSTSAGQCICNVGLFLDGSSCTLCPAGFTTSSTGSTSVAQCNVPFAGMVLVAGEGRCAVEGNCFSNWGGESNYGINEDCTFRLDGISGPLVFEQFDIEDYDCVYDFLTIAGTKYCGSTAPTGILGGAGSDISWHTDNYKNRAGFKVCVAQCPSNCAAGSGCSWEGSTESCAVCPGEQNDRALEPMSRK